MADIYIYCDMEQRVGLSVNVFWVGSTAWSG